MDGFIPEGGSVAALQLPVHFREEKGEERGEVSEGYSSESINCD